MYLRERERNVLFNDALNTFYLRLYGVRHMVKTTQIEREVTSYRHMGYSFRLAARFFFYMHHPTDRITHTTAFVTTVVKHWQERAKRKEGNILMNNALNTF